MFAAPLVVAMTLASAQPSQLALGGGGIRPAPAVPIAARLRLRPIGAALPPIMVQPAVFNTPGAGVASSATVGGPGDAAVLQKARIGATDAELVAFFRKRTPPAPSRDAILALIGKLASKELGVAEKAEGELNAIGPAAVPALREASNDIDLGAGAIRARQCLAVNEKVAAANLVTHAARLIAASKPAEAAEVLLAYSPFAEDDTVLAEIELALSALALRDGKADPAVLKALADASAIRRGAAADALCKAGGVAFHGEIRPLLADKQPSVRLRVAMGLVIAYDAEAVPVLVDLLGHLDPAQRGPVEEFLTGLAGEWAVGSPKGNDALSRRLRRDVWAAWWKNVDGASLLEQVTSRTVPNADREKLLGLIAKLGDASAEMREAASKDILAAGKKAGPLLRLAVASGDARASMLAGKCLEAIDKEDGAMPSATLRLLALRRPEGTLPALIAYLPFAETPHMQAQVVDILAAIGCPAGKADPALVEALGDELAIRRACAATALCQGRAKAQLPALKKLLADKDRQVVLRAARGLASMGQNEAVPALIGLLSDLPIDQAWEVEELLSVVAGEKTPAIALTADAPGRAKAVDAWKKWWAENAKTTDLAKLDLARRDLGLYVIVEGYNQLLGSAGRILEVDPAGKVRWEVRGLSYPNSVQLLRNGNLLVVEQENHVTERDRTGKIVGMNIYYGQVFLAERLRDGGTFLACRNLLTVRDAKNATLFTHQYFNGRIIAARRFRDGTMAFVASNGQYVKIDGTGKQTETRSLNVLGRSIVGGEITPDGRVILCDQARNTVVEYAKDGKQNWEASVPLPLNATRTAGGNVLVTCNNQTAIYEIDPRGRIVKKWENFAFRPVKVTRR